jgi:GNAT superfamily N-acetyltransferase
MWRYVAPCFGIDILRHINPYIVGRRMMTDTIEYRLAQSEDESALAELWWDMQASHHEYEPVWFADKGEEWCKASWREHYRHLLQTEQHVIVVAVAGGTPVGMIVSQFSERPPIYTTERMLVIASTVVRPDFRRRGLFKGMLSVLEDKARESGVRVMKLSVHHLNVDAVKAYDRSGFIPETTALIKWIE